MDELLRLVVILLCVPILTVSGQNTPPPQLQPRPIGPTATPPVATDRQIMLDVQVTDKSGAAVRGLQKRDFTLLDDKQPKPILSFQALDNGAKSASDPTVEVILVVDAVNASSQAVTYERNELKKFLLRDGGKLALPTSLVIFTDRGTRVQDGSSRNGNVLAELYDQYETGLRSITRSQGFYGASERLDLSLKTLTSLVAYQGKRPGRKLLIWFSPGWPILSGPNIDLSRKDQEKFFNLIVDTSNSLRLARVTLYSIDPLGMSDAGGFRTFYYQEFVKGVTSPGRTLPGNLALQVLAVQSGGRVLNSSNDLTSEIAQCTADGAAFYVISFDPARADHPNEYHALGVTIDIPGTTARTRTGYYAQP